MTQRLKRSRSPPEVTTMHRVQPVAELAASGHLSLHGHDADVTISQRSNVDRQIASERFRFIRVIVYGVPSRPQRRPADIRQDDQVGRADDEIISQRSLPHVNG